MSILSRSVRWRFLALLGASFVALGGAFWLLQRARHGQLAQAEAEWREQTRQHLARWVTVANRPVVEFARDHATLPALRAFLATPDREWARQNLDPALLDRHLEALWVLRADGTLLHHAARDETTALPRLPAPTELAAAALHRPPGDGFAETPVCLWQIHATPIVGNDGAPAGWLLTGRAWNNALLDWLSALAAADARLIAPDRIASPTADRVVWTTELRDFDGRPLRALELSQPFPGLGGPLPDGPWPALLLGAFALLLLTAFGLAVQGWVLRPLQVIGTSLEQRAPALVEPLLAPRDEFARVAALVQSAFADRAALHREVEERRRTEAELRASQEQLQHAVELRARLARDLHDHVIQSIYAAGLGLESARAQMSTDPFGTEGRLRHCLQNLNETIRQVRSYINDLEPDTTGRRQHFTDAVRALTATMHELWPVEFALAFSESASARLTNVCEIHALQIVRESLSNAIRHGGATRIEIRLREQDGDHALLEVSDNGRGFDPMQRMGTGRGLVNLTTRAREMGASLRIDAAEGRGTTIALLIPLVEAPA